MKWTDLKYLAAFILPALTYAGISMQGFWTYATLGFAFVVVPVLEYAIPLQPANYTEEEKQDRVTSFFFDGLLFLNIPIVYFLIFKGLDVLTNSALSTGEQIGLVLSLGTTLGACGINVAHELGHRPNTLYQWAAKTLLLASLYQHFFIEHNRGHHKNVGTPEDPATARKDESVFFFWMRSISLGYVHAWHLEIKRLRSQPLMRRIFLNEMTWFLFCSVGILAAVFFVFSTAGLLFFVAIALLSVFLLETINYVEHYGLFRRKKDGRYERTESVHSWNSDHALGRIMLYELTRHSDHHYMASKPYQVLDHHDEAPQLPFGYPASMLLALVPPLWFRTMNPRLPRSA